MRCCTLVAFFALSVISCPSLVADGRQEDLDGLQGTWEVVEANFNGRDVTDELAGEYTVTFIGNTMKLPAPGGTNADLSVTLNAATTPKTMDLVPTAEGHNKGEKLLAIYDLGEHELRLCMQNRPMDKRPTEFRATEGSGLGFFRFTRAAISAKRSPDHSVAADLPEDTNKISSLTPDLARALVERAKQPRVVETVRDGRRVKDWEHRNLLLNGLKSLDAETAEALTGYRKGPIQLGGLTTLDAEVARALGNAKANSLSLSGLTTLDAETAKALAKFKGNLFLEGLTTLDAEAAKALAAAEKWNGVLPALTTFDSPNSVGVARALATRKGWLSLPNLKTVSPKTLSALIEKEDIKIPPINTLELIQEPDGSVTEDFVIPKGFEKRQRAQKQ